MKSYIITVLPNTIIAGPPAWTSYSFQWVIEGVVQVQCSGEHYVLDQHTLLLTRPGMADFRAQHGQRRTRLGYVEFARSPLTPAEDESHWPMVRTLRDRDPIRPLLHHIVRLRQTVPEEHQAVERTLNLALELFVLGHQLEPPGELPQSLQSVMQYLRHVWADGRLRAVRLAELADAVSISSRHLSTLFRTQFGVGPSSALELIRVSHAATLLRTSDLTLSEVAGASGFADAYHFSHRFKHRYGLSPSRYRSAPTGPDPREPLRAAGLEPLAEHLL